MKPHRTPRRALAVLERFVATLRRTDEIRPLRLVDLQPNEAQERSRRMSLRFGAVNLTASPVYGIGGLGLVVLAVLVTVVAPGAWWVLLASILCGIVLGVALIATHRTKMGRNTAPRSLPR